MSEKHGVFEETFAIESGNFQKAGEASGAVKRFLKELGLPSAVVRRASIAVYEAEMNVVVHAYEGQLVFRVDDQAITITVSDRGPGIADVALAMREGYSTAPPSVQEMGFGAGMGLPNMEKNTDEMTIETKVGEGTTVRMVIYL